MERSGAVATGRAVVKVVVDCCDGFASYGMVDGLQWRGDNWYVSDEIGDEMADGLL